jgi:hypothetical protein
MKPTLGGHCIFRIFLANQQPRHSQEEEPGVTSLIIGLTVLAGAIALGDFLASLVKTSRIGEILRESLTIGGWLSMWRPLEIFLYDWWPIRNEAQFSERLAAIPVRIRYLNAASRDAWKADWPGGWHLPASGRKS